MPSTPDQQVPPGGDAQKAEKYIQKLVPLVSATKLAVTHTDLSKFDPSSLEDHYRIDLKDYHIEISHSKQPNTGQDSFVILFTNLQQIREGCSEKLILAYLNLSADQYKRFKTVADQQIETKKKLEEEQRFKDAMAPIDDLLNKVSSGQIDLSQGPVLDTNPPEPDSILPLVDSQKTADGSTATPAQQIETMMNATATASAAPQATQAPIQATNASTIPLTAQPAQTPDQTVPAPAVPQSTPSQDTESTSSMVTTSANNLDNELASAFSPNSNSVLTTPAANTAPV